MNLIGHTNQNGVTRGKRRMDSMTSEQFQRVQEKKGSKFRNKKVRFGTMEFDSIKEYKRFLLLNDKQNCNEISQLKCQHKFDIIIGEMKVCSYLADFTYIDKKKGFIVEDVKSDFTRKNPVYRLKRKLMIAVHKIEITEV